MKKIVIVIIFALSTLYGWEINTHRAIDKTAIESKKISNLNKFLMDSKLQDYIFEKEAINFEGYGMTYIDYIVNGETNGISNWKQNFTYKAEIKKATIKDLIEAGTILEDAQWYHSFEVNPDDLSGNWYDIDDAKDTYDRGDGRFLYHLNTGQALNIHCSYAILPIKEGYIQVKTAKFIGVFRSLVCKIAKER